MTSFFQTAVTLRTKEPIELIDLTDKIQQVVERFKCAKGLAVVSSQHTTAALVINENCPELKKDAVQFLQKWIPAGEEYRHNRVMGDGRPNAHSHLLSLALPQQLTIPVRQTRLQLGTWQRIFFVELDGPRSERKVLVTLLGGT